MEAIDKEIDAEVRDAVEFALALPSSMLVSSPATSGRKTEPTACNGLDLRRP